MKLEMTGKVCMITEYLTTLIVRGTLTYVESGIDDMLNHDRYLIDAYQESQFIE